MSVLQGGTFVGVDLAWAIDKKTSAIAVLRGDESGVELTALSGPIRGLSRVAEFISDCSAANSVVAVDAPLVVINQEGQRPCERLVSRRFGSAHAGCHTTNLGRPNALNGPRLVSRLSDRGFSHDVDIVRAASRPGRWLFEVYPHPAMVQLWGLPRIIRYKKGRVPEKRAGLRVLREHLAQLASPTFGLQDNATLRETLEQDLEALRGQRLKDYEDTLDALFCAYLAWYCWRWGPEGNEMIGTLEDGYIVVPRRSVPPQATTDPVEITE